jgi:hypothetical protein
LAAVVTAFGVLGWTALAGGSQPDDTYQSVVSGDGPAVWYQLADAPGSTELADSTGSCPATPSSMALSQEGPFGGSKAASGANIFGNAVLSCNPLKEAKAFTVEGWVDWAGTIFGQAIFSLGSSSTNYLYLTPAAPSTKKLQFEIHPSSGAPAVVIGAKKLPAEEWEYVAVTETTSGTLTLYIDGKAEGTTTGATLFPSSLGTVAHNYLHWTEGPSTAGFTGGLSNIAFYTKALSAERIEAHYHAAEFPVNTSPPLVTPTPKEATKLTAEPGTWTGLTPITYTYKWFRCNAVGGGCTTELSSTSKYKPTTEDVDHPLLIKAVAKNAAGEGTAEATTFPVEGKPVNSGLPAIEGSAEVRHLLTATPGSWTGYPAPIFSYQWEKCTEAGCAHISGATTKTYAATKEVVGATLRVTVTGTNATGAASATSAATAVVSSPCTKEWVGPKEGSWQTATNWSPASLPSNSDFVCVEAGVTVGVSEGANHAGVLLNEGALRISGGSIELAGGSRPSSVATLTIAGGTLTGSGELDVAGSFSAAAGSMEGTGSTVIEAGASGSVSESGGLGLTKRTLVNHGTFTMPSHAGISGREEAAIVNTGTFTLNSNGEAQGLLVEGSGARPTFTNMGTLRKTEGSGAADVSFAIDNEHVVSSTSGQLDFRGGGNSGLETTGSWSASGAGSEIVFAGGTYALGSTVPLAGAIRVTSNGASTHVSGGKIEGASDLVVSSGCCSSTTLEVNGTTASSVQNLSLSGGLSTLTGSGELDVAASFSAAGGSMKGTGSTVIEAGASGSLVNESGGLGLTKRTLVNHGTFTIPLHAGISGTEEAAIVNTGTFTLNGEGEAQGLFAEGIEPRPTFTNTGIVQTTEGTGAVMVGFFVENEGRFETSAAKLEFSGGGSGGTKAAWSATGLGTELVFRAGTFTFAPEMPLSGAVTVTDNGEGSSGAKVYGGSIDEVSSLTVTTSSRALCCSHGTLEIAGPTAVPNLRVALGSLIVNGDMAVTNEFVWNGGSLGGSGTTTLEGESTFGGDGSMELAGRTLVNTDAVTWGSNGLTGSGDLINEGSMRLTSSGSFTGMGGSGTFTNEGTVTNDGTPVFMGRETYNSGSLPGPPECVFCVILDPEAKPPTGECGFAVVDGLEFPSLSAKGYPPDLEPYDWKCVAPG